MIVTIVNCAPPGISLALAENLAVLRARAKRRVLLLDAGPGDRCERWAVERVRRRLRPSIAVRTLKGPGRGTKLEQLTTDFDDIVIAADGCGSVDCRWALIGAQVALVPLAPAFADVDAHYDCIAQLNNARMFNPSLRVLFAIVAGERDPAVAELGAARTYVAQVMAAGLARSTVHLPAVSWGADTPGRCASDADHSPDAAEIAALYGEIYRPGQLHRLQARPDQGPWHCQCRDPLHRHEC